jgi:hypothetical protein
LLTLRLGGDWIKFVCNGSADASVGFNLCLGYLIDRTRVSDFYRQMKDYSPQTGQLAFTLFDRRGNLRQEYKEHIIKKGSGIWGSELDTGLLLLLDSTAINHSTQSHGGTTHLLRNVIEGISDLFKKPVFAVVATSKSTASESAHCTFHNDPNQSLRSLGFRRVGNTTFFALSSDASHPCYRLPAVHDFDPAPPQPYKSTPYFNKIAADAMQSPDHLFRENLDTKYGEISARRVSGVVIGSGDDSIFHIVASRGMVQSATCMLSRWPELRNARNDAGEMPLEALKCLIEEDKVRLEYYEEEELHMGPWLSPPKNTGEILAVLRA